MNDANIYVRNQLGSKSGSRSKLSGKGSIQRNKNVLISGKMSTKMSTNINKTIGHMSSGSSSSILSSGLGKAGKTLGVIGAMLAVAEKIASFGINLNEAKTGEQIRANNASMGIKTVASLGTNFLYGAVQNELFTKKVISRQNYGLDYHRELYQLNMEGTKNKRI